LDGELPPYTSALDSTLPGENIVLAMWSERRGQWAAVQRATDGEEVTAWAPTEPLARRLAVLTALAEHRRSKVRADTAPSTDIQTDESAAGDGDLSWKISF
jgi:hypothetical protein